MTTKGRGRNGGNRATQETALDNPNRTPPIVTGQCADVLHLLRTLQPVPSFALTADHAIPETAARIHELRAKGYHVLTAIQPEFEFRGLIRRNVALYSLGVPEWPAPDFLDDQSGSDE